LSNEGQFDFRKTTLLNAWTPNCVSVEKNKNDFNYKQFSLLNQFNSPDGKLKIDMQRNTPVVKSIQPGYGS
jgi:hypothetical protein